MNPSTRIPDIVGEQEAAAVLEQAEEIIATNAASKCLSRHSRAQAMAGEIADYFAAVEDRMARVGMPSAYHLARLHNYAQQLRCYHISQLATVNAGEAESPGEWRVAPGASFILVPKDDSDPWDFEEVTVLEVLSGDRVRVARSADVIRAVLSPVTSTRPAIARREVSVDSLF